MSSSSRNSIPEGEPKPLQVTKRRRAQTENLLGKDATEIINSPVDRPEPLQSLDEYTTERIRHGLQYACFRLSHPQRKLSPLGERAMSIYKEACKDLLELENDGSLSEDKDLASTREELVSTLRTYEREMVMMRCMKIMRTKTSQEMQDEMITLKKVQLYARYRYFFAEACTKLKRFTEAKKVPGHELLQHKYWTEIQEDLEIEEPTWKKVLAGEKLHDECPVHMAISNTCANVGFSMREMLSIVRQYATHNELLHTNLELLVKDGDFDTIKRNLYTDLTSIPTILPLEKTDDVILLSRLIQELISKWFTFGEEDNDNVSAWIPSETLLRYRDDIENASATKDVESMRKQISANILATPAKREEEQAGTTRLHELLEDSLTIISLPDAQAVKRVSSMELVPEKARLKRQKVEWKALKAMATTAIMQKDVYIEEFGSLEAPLEDNIHDPRLDSP